MPICKDKPRKNKNTDALLSLDASLYRSKFWFSVGLGILMMALFAFMGAFSDEFMMGALRVSPLILIAAGVDILLFRNAPIRGGIWGIVTMMGFVTLAIIATQQAWGAPVQLETRTISYEANDHQAYALTLDGGTAQINLHALESNAPFLIDGVVNYYGTLNADADLTDATAHISIHESGAYFIGTRYGDWVLGLNPDLPLTLDVNGGIGEMVFDLSRLNLRDSAFSVGVGRLTLDLPDARESYRVTVDGGVGEVNLRIPNDTPIRLEAKSGVGSIRVTGLERIDTNDSSSFVGDEGIWQSADFEGADRSITIVYDGGIGAINVRRQ